MNGENLNTISIYTSTPDANAPGWAWVIKKNICKKVKSDEPFNFLPIVLSGPAGPYCKKVVKIAVLIPRLK